MLEFRILGPLEVRSNGVPVHLGPHKQRAVLAILLLHANEVVSVDRLIDEVWGESPPKTAAHSIQIYISELRRAFGKVSPNQVIHTRPPGYLIEVDSGSIDARRFEHLVESGSVQLSDGDRSAGVEMLRSALQMWRPPLSDFTYEEFAQNDVRRLLQLRLGAAEELASYELSQGRHREVQLLVSEVLREDPLRERCYELRMLALYRSGRHAEALRTYDELRTVLAEQLGLDPSPRMRQLQERILLHDPELGVSQSREPITRETEAAARNPYKGLRAFGERDAGDYFGREELVGHLVNVLAGGAHLVSLVGPSGSGKSSVVNAGLIPALRNGAVPGSAGWAIAHLMPGRNPFEQVEGALARVVPDSTRRPAEPARDPASLISAAARRILPDGARLLLVIDQLEELFSVTEESEQHRFLQDLAVAVVEPGAQLRVVVTLRADLYDRPLLDPVFGPVFTRSVINVHPMSAEELEPAIVRPAQLVGIEVASDLVAKLIADTITQPGALPLLQYALTELFEGRGTDVLTLDEYRSLGGLRGLVSRRSEEVFLGLGPEHQHVALQVFLRLVTLGPGTLQSRRRVPVSELTALDVDPVLLSAVLEEFGRHRLLTFDRDTVTDDATVEVAHEALLTQWDRLANWIDLHRSDLRRQQTLAIAADEWAVSSRNPDYLFTGSRLSEAEEWAESTALELTTREQAFLKASVEHRSALEEDEAIRTGHQRRLERRAKVRLLGLVATVVLLAGAVTFGALAWVGNRPADAVLLGNEPPVFRDMLVSGFDDAEEDLGLRLETVPSSGPGLLSDDVLAYSENGTRLVVVLVFDCGNVVEPVARAHPKTSYVVFDCAGDLPNITYVSFADEEGSFLAGAAAALTSDTGVIGFIGGADSPLIWKFQAGFEAGARAVNPSIEVNTSYLGQPPDNSGFDNDVLAFQVAEQMYRGGADIIFPAAGGSVTGVLEAAVQLSEDLGRHLWVIGVDVDFYGALGASDPWRPHILTSVLKRYDHAVYVLLEEHSAGTTTPGPRLFDLATGGVDLAYSGGFIDDLRPQIDELRTQVISGQIDVPEIPSDKVDAAAEMGITSELGG